VRLGWPLGEIYRVSRCHLKFVSHKKIFQISQGFNLHLHPFTPSVKLTRMLNMPLRLRIFEFLALPAHVWISLAARLCGMRFECGPADSHDWDRRR